MDKIYSILFTIMGLIVILGTFLVTKDNAPGPAFGGAPPGLPAATSTVESLINVSNTVATAFEASTNCASRVIGTASTSVILSFGSTTPSQLLGYPQGASTTVVYDAGLYGCGQWRVYGNAIGSINVTEFK